MQQSSATNANLPLGSIVTFPLPVTGRPAGLNAPVASIAYAEIVWRLVFTTYANRFDGSTAIAAVPKPSDPFALNGEPGIARNEPVTASIEKADTPALETTYACLPDGSTTIPAGSEAKSADADGTPATRRNAPDRASTL